MSRHQRRYPRPSLATPPYRYLFTQLNDQTVLFQAIQFSISDLFALC